MGCSVCATIFLIIVNIGVMIFGLLFTVLGGILTWGETFLTPYIKPMLDGMISSLTSQSGGSLTSEDVIHFLFETFQNNGILALFFVGLILVAVSVFGFVAACCRVELAMTIFIILNGAMMFVEVLLIIMYFAMQADFEKKGRDYFFKVTQKYTGLNSGNADSLVLNLVHAQMECCGANNGQDYWTALNWNRTREFNSTSSFQLQYPITCCKLENFQPVDTMCILQHWSNNSNYMTGCFNVLKEKAGVYMIIFAIVLVAVSLCQALLITATLTLLNNKKSKVDPHEYSIDS